MEENSQSVVFVPVDYREKKELEKRSRRASLRGSCEGLKVEVGVPQALNDLRQSKKALITSHINTHHKEEVEKAKIDKGHEADGVKSNICKECDATFKKPAYLIQHMQSHSLEGNNL
ncbi:hypothetical protein L6164_017629 [Bauhinia variegata]|uniref:Uncharacterized protein n=1 Tax=Bauhinia variegata TaxID=167791 RepID=A0ACB9NC09_BAUVA|nr:hypothetical protein L6164_017629 [Bauhinia variegata]